MGSGSSLRPCHISYADWDFAVQTKRFTIVLLLRYRPFWPSWNCELLSLCRSIALRYETTRGTAIPRGAPGVRKPKSRQRQFYFSIYIDVLPGYFSTT
eukprot:2615782-Rhodomonas_salina.1